MLETLHVDIPDARLDHKYGGKAPWVNDPRIVYVVREVKGDQPIIKRYRYRNLKRRGLCIPFMREFHVEREMEYRCFYTNAVVYLTDGRLLGNPTGDAGPTWRAIPWALTREHVVPRRERDMLRTNTIGNMVPCALFMNYSMAHMPLAIKLYERDYLHQMAFDREAMTFETAWFVRNKIVEFERRFWFVDNYPWFPHAIKDQQAKLAAEEFFGVLRQHEERFLDLAWRDQRTFLKQPCDIDVAALAVSILGLTV